ncbi:MAG TPA: hypothetical protein VKB26_06600, partial [Candidatus Acidoferrales bacterium]|nr:hypothetical protein [Candidatus Acidoferrales bacterium]
MDFGVETIRNTISGELILRRASDSAASDSQPAQPRATIKINVGLVEVACNVFAADGTAVRGLTENQFRVFEDGAEQKIQHFDASSEGANIALVIDASPSVLPDTVAMKAAAQELIAGLSPADEVAVIDFAEHTFLLLPFSRDRRLLAKAVAGVDVRALFSDTIGSNIYRSLYL